MNVVDYVHHYPEELALKDQIHIEDLGPYAKEEGHHDNEERLSCKWIFKFAVEALPKGSKKEVKT